MSICILFWFICINHPELPSRFLREKKTVSWHKKLCFNLRALRYNYIICNFILLILRRCTSLPLNLNLNFVILKYAEVVKNRMSAVCMNVFFLHLLWIKYFFQKTIMKNIKITRIFMKYNNTIIKDINHYNIFW